MRKLLQ